MVAIILVLGATGNDGKPKKGVMDPPPPWILDQRDREMKGEMNIQIRKTMDLWAEYRNIVFQKNGMAMARVRHPVSVIVSVHRACPADPSPSHVETRRG